MATSQFDHWKDLSTEWQESGTIGKEFSQEKNFARANFVSWRTKLNKIERIQGPEQEGFVRCHRSSLSTQGFTLECPDGMKISFPAHITFQECVAKI